MNNASNGEPQQSSPSVGTRALVAVPTTGGVVLVANLRSRPRLRASYMTVAGDFRPLPLSTAYAQLLQGPLADEIGEGPFELVLSEGVETGRSWELPVTLAHLLAEADALATASDAVDDFSSYAPTVLVWATGKLDSTLAPMPDDYRIDLKCAVSEDLFAAAHKAGVPIRMLVPDEISPTERDAVDAVVQRWGAVCATATDGAIVRDVATELGGARAVIETPAAVVAGATTAALPGDPPRDAISGASPGPDISDISSVASADPVGLAGLSRTWLALAAACVVVVAGLAFAFGSGLSTRTATTPAPVVLRVLKAESEAECQRAIMLATPLKSKAIALKGGAFTVPAGAALCGLAFRNTADSPQRMRLDDELLNQGAFGHTPLATADAIGPNEEAVVYFGIAPQPGRYGLALESNQQLSVVIQ